MTSTDDLLAMAESAPPPHRDVDVWIGEDVSQRIHELEDEAEAAAADLRYGDPRPAELAAEMERVRSEAQGDLVTLRFTKLAAAAWSELTSRAPVRLDSPIDRNYGYNVTLVGEAAARNVGRRVVDGVEEALSPEQWGRLFAVMSGHEFQKIVEAVFQLNEYGPEQRIAAAKKASRAGIDSKST